MIIKRLLRSGWLLGLLATSQGRAQSLAGQAALDSLRAAYRLPALLAAVIEPGRIRYVYAGRRRLDQPAPVRLTDYFHLGSDTKGVTSLLAGKLFEQGKIKWESKLLDFVPELRGHVLPAYEAVTLGDLLAHRAGIRPYTAGSEFVGLPVFTGTSSAQRAQFAALVLQQTPVANPAGSAYAYSNAGYALAALMLERASHHTWEELLAKMCRQLRLHYGLGWPNRHDPAQPWVHWRAAPTDSALTPLGPAHPYQLAEVVAPAGDLSLPLPDFARLMQLHLRGLLGQDNYVTANTYQTLHFSRPEYAYGWGVSALAATGAPVSFHDGTAGTFYCHAILYPSQKVAFVVLTNAGGEPAAQACLALRRRLKALYLRGAL